MLFGRRKPGFVREEEIQGGPVVKGASASIDKDGVITVESGGETAAAGESAENAAGIAENAGKTGSRKNLLDFLTEQPEAEDPFSGISSALASASASVPASAPASAAAGTATAAGEPEPQDLTKAQQLAQFIRERSAGAHLTSYQMLKADDEEIDGILEKMKQEEDCGDIAIVRGNKDIYYYSNGNMSDNYAMIAMYVEEKDLVVTIAQMVRFNCRTYPAPTPLVYFEKHPYYYTMPQLKRAIALLEASEEYKDIYQLKNSQGTLYLFSDQTMSLKYARALIEPEEYTD